jgi:ABC-type antimicrobial peptide transport system permease subunit
MSAAGIVLGVIVAVPIGRLIHPLLFGVELIDPAVLVATAACVLAAAIGATMIPMSAAARTDPLAALRGE